MKKHKIIIILLILILILTIIITLNIINSNKVAVLGYHSILPQKENATDNLTIDLEVFNKQLDIIDKLGYKTLSLEEFDCWKKKKCKKPHKSVLITFDDGYVNNYEYAFEALKKRNMNAVVFVIGSYVGEGGGEHMSRKMIEDIAINFKNIDVASHSHNLHYHSDKTYDEVQNDIVKMSNVIKTKYYAYPFGDYNNDYIKALKDNDYSLAFTFGPDKEHRKADIKDDDFKIPRLNISRNMSLHKFALRLILPI